MTFKYATEAYPEKGFPTDTQIGWVADELLSVVPELVITDKDGFKSVAYARASALVAQAVTELRAETTAQYEDLRKEIDELRKNLLALTEKMPLNGA